MSMNILVFGVFALMVFCSAVMVIGRSDHKKPPTP